MATEIKASKLNNAGRESALAAFNAYYGPGDDPSPLERLRAFCSFAMSGQDWLDVEPFFDALAAASVVPAEPDLYEGEKLLPYERRTAADAALFRECLSAYRMGLVQGSAVDDRGLLVRGYVDVFLAAMAAPPAAQEKQ